MPVRFDSIILSTYLEEQRICTPLKSFYIERACAEGGSKDKGCSYARLEGTCGDKRYNSTHSYCSARCSLVVNITLRPL